MSNYHGVKLLETKITKIELNKTNKNDLIKLIGEPSTISDFDKNKWFYFERLKTNQSLFKLGAQKIEKNNILIVKFNQYGVVEKKNMLDLNNMNDLKEMKDITYKDFENKNMLYNVFSSLREKINAPARKRAQSKK